VDYCTDVAVDRIWHWITIILTYKTNDNGDNRKRNGINFRSQLQRLVSYLMMSVFVRWPCKRHAVGLTNTAALGAFAYCSVNRRKRAISLSSVTATRRAAAAAGDKRSRYNVALALMPEMWRIGGNHLETVRWACQLHKFRIALHVPVDYGLRCFFLKSFSHRRWF